MDTERQQMQRDIEDLKQRIEALEGAKKKPK